MHQRKRKSKVPLGQRPHVRRMMKRLFAPSAVLRGFRSASALLKSVGQDGPLLYPGPLYGGESGTRGRAAGVDRTSTPFRQHMDVLSKSPAPAHGLAGQEPGKRQAGWPSLWFLSLGQSRERDSPSEGGRKPLLWNSIDGDDRDDRARASRTGL